MQFLSWMLLMLFTQCKGSRVDEPDSLLDLLVVHVVPDPLVRVPGDGFSPSTLPLGLELVFHVHHHHHEGRRSKNLHYLRGILIRIFHNYTKNNDIHVWYMTSMTPFHDIFTSSWVSHPPWILPIHELRSPSHPSHSATDSHRDSPSPAVTGCSWKYIRWKIFVWKFSSKCTTNECALVMTDTYLLGPWMPHLPFLSWHELTLPARQ